MNSAYPWQGQEPPTSYDDSPEPALEDCEPEQQSVVDRVLPIIDWHQLWAEEQEEEWILEPLLQARRSVALFSAPKAGKSLLMLELAVAVSNGTEALSATPDRPRRVLYVDFENDPRGDIRTRLADMGYGPEDLSNLCYLSFPSIPKLDTAAGGLHLLAAVHHYACEVVIIDTVSRVITGEESANDTWLAFYRNTGLALKQAGVACIRLDHSGKDESKGMRGGSAKYGDVDAVWRLNAISEDTITLECTDHRMKVLEKHLTLTRETNPLRHRVNGNAWTAAYEAEVSNILEQLDRHDIPRAWGRTRVRNAGITGSNTALSKALKIWKVTPQNLSGTGDPSLLAPDLSPSQGQDTPNHAQKPVPDSPRTAGAPVSGDLSVLPPLLVGGQVHDPDPNGDER